MINFIFYSIPLLVFLFVCKEKKNLLPAAQFVSYTYWINLSPGFGLNGSLNPGIRESYIAYFLFNLSRKKYLKPLKESFSYF